MLNKKIYFKISFGKIFLLFFGTILVIKGLLNLDEELFLLLGFLSNIFIIFSYMLNFLEIYFNFKQAFIKNTFNNLLLNEIEILFQFRLKIIKIYVELLVTLKLVFYLGFFYITFMFNKVFQCFLDSFLFDYKRFVSRLVSTVQIFKLKGKGFSLPSGSALSSKTKSIGLSKLVFFGPYFDTSYSYVLFIVTFITFISLTLFLISYLFIPRNFSSEKISSYECGFDPYSIPCEQFEIGFYLVGILFLLMDIEIAFLYPFSVVAFSSSGFAKIVLFLFVFFAVVGYYYEYSKNVFITIS